MWRRLFNREIKVNYTGLVLFGIVIVSLSTSISMFIKKQEVRTNYVPVVKERVVNRKVIDSLMNAREEAILDSMNRQDARLLQELRNKQRTINNLIKERDEYRTAYDSIYISRPVF